MKRIAIVLGLMLSVCTAAAPARANDSRQHGSASPSSVFPIPRDPWRSWGTHRDHRDLPQLRDELPRHVGPPRVHGRASAGRASAWMPAQWVWDGHSWVWWPGGWVR
jgi:hypothetical protein